MAKTRHPHHPHYLETITPWPHERYKFRPFTGDEPDPETLLKDNLLQDCDRATASAIRGEYRAAQNKWKAAVRCRDVRMWAEQAVPAWEEYTKARARMDAAFERVQDGDPADYADDVKHLKRTHTRTLEAAKEWDKQASNVAYAYWNARECVLELMPSIGEICEAAGIDASDWVVAPPDDYESWSRSTPLVAEVEKEIARHLKQAPEAGDGVPAKSGSWWSW